MSNTVKISFGDVLFILFGTIELIIGSVFCYLNQRNCPGRLPTLSYTPTITEAGTQITPTTRSQMHKSDCGGYLWYIPMIFGALFLSFGLIMVIIGNWNNCRMLTNAIGRKVHSLHDSIASVFRRPVLKLFNTKEATTIIRYGSTETINASDYTIIADIKQGAGEDEIETARTEAAIIETARTDLAIVPSHVLRV